MSKREKYLSTMTGEVVVLDMRDEVITNDAQFLDALDRFRRNHTQRVGVIRLCPTQAHCLKFEAMQGIYNVKEDRPYRPDEFGSLQHYRGYPVVIGDSEIVYDTHR